MNLQLTKQATPGLHNVWTMIDRNKGLDTRHVLGECVNEYPVRHGNGDMTQCGYTVYAGEGYADLDGTPFQAYYCAKCAATK